MQQDSASANNDRASNPKENVPMQSLPNTMGRLVVDVFVQWHLLRWHVVYNNLKQDKSQVIPQAIRKTYHLFKATVEYLYRFLSECPPPLPKESHNLLPYKDALILIANDAMNRVHESGFPGVDKQPKATCFKKWCCDNEDRMPSLLADEEYVKAKTLIHIPHDFKTPAMSKSRKRKVES